jgi:hypothetical protein
MVRKLVLSIGDLNEDFNTPLSGSPSKIALPNPLAAPL